MMPIVLISEFYVNKNIIYLATCNEDAVSAAQPAERVAMINLNADSHSSSPTVSEHFLVSEEGLTGRGQNTQATEGEVWQGGTERGESDTGGRHDETRTEDDSTLTESKKNEKGPEKQQGLHRSSQGNTETTESDQGEEKEEENNGLQGEKPLSDVGATKKDTVKRPHHVPGGTELHQVQ
ncbi:hypothetical protein NDU88_000995 [Pleurodeles waltl]|uniref:Uncharacterized protein n=1 Tax=Pleurodeles waltl TaxID=8319 RepID=A0AAV7SYZ2_PLEWA|nr:hypothetical protein NDU88_000995 [Pleurodeles waltl]